MSAVLPVFKSWVPVWLIRLAIFMAILPGLILFGLSSVNITAASGYYGMEPADVQYSMLVFYAAVCGFFALERRFFIFTATREYFLLSIIVQVITAYVCYHTQHAYILFIFRFIEGMANCMATSICITLIFGSLNSERAREIGYSVFYGMLLCVTPVSTFITAPILDNFDYNVLYKFIIFAYLPGGILLLLIMNNVRLNRKMPLYQLEVYSFIIYSVLLLLIGYTLAYGQQYYWFDDIRIIRSVIAIVLLMAILILRQLKLKRPYLNLRVFKYRNFVAGMFMIAFLYIIRGAFSIVSTYFTAILGMDPTHLGNIMLYNVLGIVLGVLISSRLLILKRPTRLVWIYGFICLLIFHVWMWFLFSTQADADTFIAPLILQGIGAGLLMMPIIVYSISSVPVHLSSSASATGVFFRFTSFAGSIAIINYFQLQHKANHYNRFQEQLSGLNTQLTERLNLYSRIVSAKGVPVDQAAKIGRGLLNRSVDVQAQLRYMMDYYYFISIVIIAAILLIAMFPFLNRTKINVKSSQPSPVSF